MAKKKPSLPAGRSSSSSISSSGPSVSAGVVYSDGTFDFLPSTFTKAAADASGSKQLTEAPYRKLFSQGIVEPLYDLDQLCLLPENSYMHSSCLPPGSLVLDAEAAPMAIETLDSKRVLDGIGAIQSARLLSRPYDGGMVVLMVKGLPEPVRLTPEHPVWTARGWIQVGEITLEDEVWQPVSPLLAGGSYGDGWLIGLWLAEGSYGGGNGLRFACHENEVPYLVERFTAWWYDPPVTKGPRPTGPRVHSAGPHGRMIHIHHPDLLRLVEVWTEGKHALTKRLRVIPAARDLAKGILDGWLFGDGHSAGGGRTGSSSSPVLAWQMFHIASSLGYVTSLRHRPNTGGPQNRASVAAPSYKVNVQEVGYGTRRAYREKVLEARSLVASGVSKTAVARKLKVCPATVTRWLRPERQHHGQPRLAPGGLWRRVIAVERESFEGHVYDLSLPGEHSFIAGGIRVHNCLDQKTTDVIGSGWEWVPREGDEASADKEQRRVLDRWFTSLADTSRDGSMIELLTSVMFDYEAISGAYFEMARKTTGKLDKLFYVPAHTIYAHTDRRRFVQVREGQEVWFRRWGIPNPAPILDSSGEIAPAGTPVDKLANDILPIQGTYRRSSFYGVPSWISNVGYISLGIAARDYNLMFFSNRREPNWLVLIKGCDNAQLVKDEITLAMRTQLRQPHRNLVVAIESGGEIAFHKLSEAAPEMAFRNLVGITEDVVLVSHRMPPDRIGVTRRRGPLGGSVAGVTNRVYREGFVKPRQSILATRINALIQHEFMNDNAEPDWLWAAKELDITEEHQDLRDGIALFDSGVGTLNEARARGHLPPDDGDSGSKYAWQLGIMKQPGGREPSGEPTGLQMSDDGNSQPSLNGQRTVPMDPDDIHFTLAEVLERLEDMEAPRQ